MTRYALILLGVVFLTVIFAAGCTKSTPKNDPLTDECGDIKAATFPIINGRGWPEPTVADLNESQQKAVGALRINMGFGSCSATLIAPNVVLTAAHCVSGGIFSLHFVGGLDYRNPDFTFAAWEWHAHPLWNEWPPEYDFGVVLINGDTAAEGITPIPVNCETKRLVGQAIETAGYGMTYMGDARNSQRWWTTLTVNMETPTWYSAYGNEVTGTCMGDSGGPMLYTMPDGQVYVMGVVSSGDDEDTCLGHTFYPRTDFHCDFIPEYLPATDPCEGETIVGRCEGNVAVWCEAETIIRDDCDALGYICDLDSSGNYRCMMPADPCEGETFEGRCDGNTAIWCDADIVNTWPCPENTLCGNLGDGLYRCVDECMLIGRTGRCDENGRAWWCEGDVKRMRDCAFCNQLCGWLDDVMGFYCL